MRDVVRVVVLEQRVAPRRSAPDVRAVDVQLVAPVRRDPHTRLLDVVNDRECAAKLHEEVTVEPWIDARARTRHRTAVTPDPRSPSLHRPSRALRMLDDHTVIDVMARNVDRAGLSPACSMVRHARESRYSFI